MLMQPVKLAFEEDAVLESSVQDTTEGKRHQCKNIFLETQINMEDILLIVIVSIIILLVLAYLFVMIKQAIDKEEKRDWLTKEEAEAFTGQNGAYYLNKWKDRPESFFKGWNWAAAFFFVEWLAYRKMYDRSFFMLPGFWIGIRPRSVPIAIFFYLIFSRFLNSWLAVIVSVMISRFIGGGLFGNVVYREAALEALRKSLHMSEPARLDYLKSKGGTNAIAPVIAIVVQAVIITLLIIFYR